MAAKLMQHALAALGEPYNQIEVISAGISALPNQHPTQHSVEALRHVHLDISRHRSQMLTQDMLDRAFAVFVMTDSHLDLIEMSFNRIPKNIFRMRDFIPNTNDKDIPDPFGESYETYVACRDSMVEALPSLVKYVQTNFPIQELTQS